MSATFAGKQELGSIAPSRVAAMGQSPCDGPAATGSEDGHDPCPLAAGRISGRLRTTPVSLLSVAGQRYIVAGLDDADWVRNARAAGWGILRYGRSEERVALNELPVGERSDPARISALVPHGVQYFQRMYG